MTTVVRYAIWFLVSVGVLGVFVGLFEIGLLSLMGYEFPSWSLAQYLIAAFAMGIIYLVGEFVWQPIGRILVDADSVTDPLWKRLFRALILILIGFFPIVAYMVWQLKGTG